MTTRRKSIPALFIFCLSVMALLVACVPPATNPDGSINQTTPIGLHGMAEDLGASGTTVWGADLFGRQLLRFDPDTSRIEERYGPAEGLCGTDDLVVMPDGSLVATCPSSGEVIRIPRNGTAEVLANVGEGVNPIAIDPDGKSVLVGFGAGTDDRLLRIPIDGSPVQTVASGLPLLNGFAFGADGFLYVPTGGAAGIFGTGGLGRIDVRTGTLIEIPVTFPEPSKRGFDFACGVDAGPDGTIYVAQCVNPAVYTVDPTTGAATLVGRSGEGVADNVEALTDGRVILSGFLGARYTVFTPTADGGWTSAHHTVGG